MSSNAIKKILNTFLLPSLLLLTGFNAESCPEAADFPIALDIGHTPSHPGRISARGVPEYQFNKRLAEYLQQRLKEAGFTTTFILTANDPEMPLFVRASLANVRDAAILLSLHHDSVQQHYLSRWEYKGNPYEYSDKFSGYSLFVSDKNGDPQKSRVFADLLGQTLLKRGFTPTLHHAEPISGENRTLLDQEKGVYQFDTLLILQNTRVPAVLMECGVLVNRNEEILLNNPVYRYALTQAVLEAVKKYFDLWRNEVCKSE
jgi:N-acetylmuramoyl-L-alanine amidase